MPSAKPAQLSFKRGLRGDAHHMKQILFFLLFPLFLFGTPQSARILLELKHGSTDRALAEYLYLAQVHGHSIPLLQKMASTLLQKGIESPNLQTQFFSILALSLAPSEQITPLVQPIWERKNDPLIGVLLNLAPNLPDSLVKRAIRHAMHSPFIPLKVAAVETMSLLGSEETLFHIETMKSKFPPAVFRELIPAICRFSSKKSAHLIGQALASSVQSVRIQAIYSIGESGKDEWVHLLYPFLRHPDRHTVEAVIGALGKLSDIQALQQVQALENHVDLYVQLASKKVLAQAGRGIDNESVIPLASGGNPLAIAVLSSIPGGESALAELVQARDPLIQVNAVMGLAALKKKVCLPFFLPYLIGSSSHLKIYPIQSPGKALQAWGVYPPTHPNDDLSSIRIKQKWIEQCATFLSDAEFISFTKKILTTGNTDYIPTCLRCIGAYHTNRATQFLREVEQYPGHPHARAWATLTLFTTEQKEKDKQELIRYLLGEMIKHKVTFLPPKNRNTSDPFSLPTDSFSEYYLAAFETLLQTGDQRTLDILLNALIHGHPENRFILAGFLLRATE